MNDDLEMTRNPHPLVAPFLKQYARDLAQISPSSELDARISALVADGFQHLARDHATVARHAPRYWKFAAAAGLAALAIGMGIFIGMKLEHARDRVAAHAMTPHDAEWPPADLTMWPTDSVSFKIPAEYSAQGTLVVVDPQSKNTSTRYWIDVVVANDGTFRIERIVPANATHKPGALDDVAPKIQ